MNIYEQKGIDNCSPNEMGANRLYFGGVASQMSDDELVGLLETLGAIRKLHIVREVNKDDCYGYFEYRDDSLSKAAVDGFHGLELGTHTMIIKIDPTPIVETRPVAPNNENTHRRSRSRSRDRDRVINKDTSSSSADNNTSSTTVSQSRRSRFSTAPSSSNTTDTTSLSTPTATSSRRSRFSSAPPPTAIAGVNKAPHQTTTTTTTTGGGALLPGPPTVTTLLPMGAPLVAPAPTMAQAMASAAMDLTTKELRTIYCGNIPDSTNEYNIAQVLNATLVWAGYAPEGSNPIIHVRINPKYCFLTLQTVEIATNLLNLDQIKWIGHNCALKRPSKYVGPPDTNKQYLDVCKEKKDAGAGPPPLGWPLELITDGDDVSANYQMQLTASINSALPPLDAGLIELAKQLQLEKDKKTPSVVVRLSNMVTIEDLSDIDTYEDIVDDTQDECALVAGEVHTLYIPRPPESSGIGFVYVEFMNIPSAEKAVAVLGGRTFGGRVVEATYYPLEKYKEKIYY